MAPRPLSCCHGTDLFQSQSSADTGCPCGCTKPHVAQAAFTPLTYTIPWNCPAPAFALSWHKGGSVPKLPCPDMLRVKRKVLEAVLVGLLALVNSVPREAAAHGSRACSERPFGRTKLPQVLRPGGVDARQRHNTRTSEIKVLRNWEVMALVWSRAVEGRQKLDMFLDRHLGRRYSLIPFL